MYRVVTMNGDGMVLDGFVVRGGRGALTGHRCVISNNFSGDGIVDFSDYLEFLNLFETGCGPRPPPSSATFAGTRRSQTDPDGIPVHP